MKEKIIKDKVIGIYLGSYCTDDEDCDGVDSNKYNDIFYKALNLIKHELYNFETVHGLLLNENLGMWEAEILNSETGDCSYRIIDQSIFENI